MHQLPVIQPIGSPSCWGQKYQDGDIECGQCRFNDSCRKEVLRGAMNAPLPNQIPFPTRPQFPQQQPQWPAPSQYQQAPMVPLPSVPLRPMPPPQYQQPIPVPVAPLYPTGYQQHHQQPQPASFFALPAYMPDPMQPWSRPGANASPYYFGQYPGETAVQRITKNLILRAIAAVAQELLGFFIQWTWPPSRNNNQG